MTFNNTYADKIKLDRRKNMSREKKVSQQISKDVQEFILKNRSDVPVRILHGSEPTRIEENRLVGGHFKIRSAFKVCKLSEKEVKQALS